MKTRMKTGHVNGQTITRGGGQKKEVKKVSMVNILSI
jgi:hypothetical protein